MLRQEERATVSLRSFGSLIRVTGRKARIEEAKIDHLVDELKKGNFQGISEFERLIDDILNNILENIKLYAERDENKKIETIYQFLSEFFNYHMFDVLDNETIKEIRSGFDKDLKEIIKKLRQEKRSERRVSHGKKPVHAMFKKLFRSNRSLDRKVMRDGKKEIGLENEEEDIRKKLKYLLTLLTKERERLSHEQVKQLKEKVKELLLHFVKVALQEFESLFDAEVDVEIQEADLIHDIDDIMKIAKKNPEMFQRLQQIKAKIESHCKTDFYVARRMLYRAKSLKQNVDGRFVKAEEGKKGVPLVTQFADGSVVLNIKNKLFVFNPFYLLSKHGANTKEVGSKFSRIATPVDLYKFLVREISSHINKIKGDRYEIHTSEPGTDSLIPVKEVPKYGHRDIEIVRKTFSINVVHTRKPFPKSNEAHIIIVSFSNEFYPHLEKDFYMKYGKYMGDFEGIFSILTCFPGTNAPPMDNQSFWGKHALLKR